MKYTLTLMVLTILLIIFACHKKEEFPYFPQHMHGRIYDVESSIDVPFAKVYLMEAKTESGNGVDPTRFSAWDKLDSLIADEKGAYSFDFERRKIYRYGIYAVHPHYFDHEDIAMYGGVHYDSELYNAPLYPKAYLVMHFQDVFPYRDIDSILVPSAGVQESFWLKGNPIDTTIVRWLNIFEGIIDWRIYENNTVEVQGAYIDCPSLDTCYHQVRL